MLSPIIVAALVVLALLALASIRRIPEGHVYALRRMDGHVRIVGSGTHLLVPIVERVARKISLAGAVVAVEDLRLSDQHYRGVIYFQVLDPERAEVVLEDVENVLRAAARRLFVDTAMPGSADARRTWLKQALNAQLRASGLLIARVDLNALD